MPRPLKNLERQTAENAAPPKAHLDDRPQLRSGAFTIDDKWRLHIPHVLASPGSPSKSIFNLNDALLPAVPFSRIGLKLSDRPDLRISLVLALDASFLNSGRHKQIHSTASAQINTLLKTFEYGWINGLYSLSDWTQRDFSKLGMALREEGWYGALRIESRCSEMLQDLSKAQRAALWTIRRYKSSNSISLSDSTVVLLRSNIRHWELFKARRYLASQMIDVIPELRDTAERDTKYAGMRRATTLSRDFRAINQLATLNTGLQFLPFPHPTKLASKLAGDSGRRTKSLTPDVVAKLLTNAHWWLYKVGPILKSAYDELLEKKETLPISSEPRKHLSKLGRIQELGRLTGFQITSYSGSRNRATRSANEISLSSLTSCVYCAAFISIALLNARRKDEIQHSRIGIRSKSYQVMDEKLKLFCCEFYIEKTKQEHVTFYVGEWTKDAISLLSELSEIARILDGDLNSQDIPNHKGYPIFRIPAVSRSLIHSMQWFDFGIRRFRDPFLSHTFGNASEIHISAHMFRRAYALLFHYRYENSTLQALSQQLGHLDLEMTSVYVTDTASTIAAETGATLYTPITTKQLKTVEMERYAISEELGKVGFEKLVEFVEYVLQGKNASSGGYGRFVQRFHKALRGQIHYDALDLTAKARVLSESLRRKGHTPLPMPHGTCMAGETTSRLRGHCYSDVRKDLVRASAGPAVCANCPYHLVTLQHLNNLKNELQQLEAQYGKAKGRAHSIIDDARYTDMIALRTIIDLHEKRLSDGTNKPQLP